MERSTGSCRVSGAQSQLGAETLRGSECIKRWPLTVAPVHEILAVEHCTTLLGVTVMLVTEPSAESTCARVGRPSDSLGAPANTLPTLPPALRILTRLGTEAAKAGATATAARTIGLARCMMIWMLPEMQRRGMQRDDEGSQRVRSSVWSGDACVPVFVW